MRFLYAIGQDLGGLTKEKFNGKDRNENNR